MTVMDGDRDSARRDHRAITALEAHRDGETWQVAAERAGFTTRGAAYRSVMRLLARRADAAANELRAEASARHAGKIAMLEDVIYDLDKPLRDRLLAVDAHTRAEARFARLMGLDAPVQVAISAGVQADLADALAELGEVLGEVVPGEVTASDDDGEG
jgi:hypothetical protein